MKIIQRPEDPEIKDFEEKFNRDPVGKVHNILLFIAITLMLIGILDSYNPRLISSYIKTQEIK